MTDRASVDDPASSSNGGLGKRATRGAAVTLVGQILRVAVQAVGVVVIARLLDPTDFGLVAMVLAIVGVGEVIRDFGLGMAAVQAESLSVKQRSNLFWLNSAIGAIVAALAFASSWAIAGLYGEPRLIAITQALSLTFVVNGIASQYRASLQRRLAFAWLALVEVLSLSVGVATGILAALAGWEYWAIVAQQLVQTLAGLLLVVLGARWIPRGIYRGQRMRGFIRFGWNVVGYQLLTYASKNADSIAIGSQFGAVQLGYYNRAFQLLTVPLNQLGTPLGRVAVSALARAQNDSARFNAYLVRGQTALMSFVLFILAALCGLAEPAVSLLLGPQWVPTAGLFQILAIAGAFQVASYFVLWAFLARGLTGANLRQALVTRPLLICAIVIGATISVDAVAWAYAIGTALAWPIGLIWLGRVSDVDTRHLAGAALRSMTAFALAGAAAFLVQWSLPTTPAWIVCTLGLVAMLIVLGVLALAWPTLRRDFAGVFQAIQFLKHSR